MFESVLVANRGEIAVRVIKTLSALGIRAIAVYSDADADAPHVGLADEAVRLGPAPAAQSYLSIERVLEAARATCAEAIHPGYGFLSENAAFARACREAGIVFIGPPPEAMELLGDKVRAKLAAREAGVPVLDGLHRPGLTDEEIIAFVSDAPERLPVMIKASAGGGGRGMRIVRSVAELPDALASARREALAGFGDDALLVEQYVERARHIEVQLLADAHGKVIHLGERECSLQRRHQKVLEESPSPAVDTGLRDRLGAAAVGIARHAGYVGAGTAEFLIPFDDPSRFAFLEVNARLQVEHPVTEEVTGFDLVELQLRVAAGEPLTIEQSQVALRGHSIEVRVCAEDPASGFLPATGTIVTYREPRGSGIRVDSGVRSGSEVSGSYDSLLLKVIATGTDRSQALDRLHAALGGLRTLGITTNAGYLARLAAADPVRAGELDTGLLERGVAALEPGSDQLHEAAIAAAVVESLELADRTAAGDPWDRLAGWRLTGEAGVEWELEHGAGSEPITVHVSGPPERATVRVAQDEQRSSQTPFVTNAGCNERRSVSAADAGGGRVRIASDGHTRLWDHAVAGSQRWVAAGADAFSFKLAELVSEGASAGAEGALEAPMPGSVLSVRVSGGDEVQEGDLLMIVESMKMELSIVAPSAATVREVRVAEGDRVAQGQLLVELDAAGV